MFLLCDYTGSAMGKYEYNFTLRLLEIQSFV